jgi:hypothetical protein
VHVNLTRRMRTWLAGAVISVGLAPAAHAQVVPCDFDVADDMGLNFFGSTAHLTGRAGASSIRGQFFIINADKAEMDVDRDGFTTSGCAYTDLYVPPDSRINLINVDNPALAIPGANIILINLPHGLPAGTSARVEVYVEIPEGTPAGRYIGEFQIRDRVIPAAFGPNNEITSLDRIAVEVEVLRDLAFTIVNSDTAKRLDSLTIRARSGQRASGVFRIANEGNAPLTDVRLSATDLRSESAVGLVIPKENVTFSAPSFATLLTTDTARVTVTAQVPRGILGGRYRGAITVQSNNTASQTLPLIVIVTSSRGILFENNPVRAVNGDIGRIAFNGDPGTTFKIAIFDMAGLMVFSREGQVFPGVGGTSTTPTAGADFAASVSWPLVNGIGQPVASGMYLVVVESIVNGQRQLARDRLMVIR